MIKFIKRLFSKKDNNDLKNERKEKIDELFKKHSKVKEISLSISFKNGSSTRISAEYDAKSDITYIKHFKHFYKWWFYRESDYFLFKVKDGGVVIIRSEVLNIIFNEKIINKRI